MQRRESNYKTSKILLICFIIISNLIHPDNFTLINNITNKSIMLEYSNKQQEIFKNYPLILYNDVSFDSTRYGLKIENCPNGDQPQLLVTGQIKWCKIDSECQPLFECITIMGLYHFGEAIRYCCPTKASSCIEPPDNELKRSQYQILKHHCKEIGTKFFYFDNRRLKCLEKVGLPECSNVPALFSLNINKKSNNHFKTIEECRHKCESTACKLGENIYLLDNENYDEPLICKSSKDCPIGYNCRHDKLLSRKVCCGFKNFEPCPNGFFAFIVPFTGRAKKCTKNLVRDGCSSPFLCITNNIDQNNYCCAKEEGVCPHGQQPFIHSLTDQIIKCNPHDYEAACPPGYVCSAAILGLTWGFCCSKSIVVNCPKGSTSLLNHFTNQPQSCYVGDETCGRYHYCKEMDNGKGVCCSRLIRKIYKPKLEIHFNGSLSKNLKKSKLTKIKKTKPKKSSDEDIKISIESSTIDYETTEIVPELLETSTNTINYIWSSTIENILDNSEIDVDQDINEITNTNEEISRLVMSLEEEKERLNLLEKNIYEKYVEVSSSENFENSLEKNVVDLLKKIKNQNKDFESPTERELHKIKTKLNELIAKKKEEKMIINIPPLNVIENHIPITKSTPIKLRIIPTQEPDNSNTIEDYKPININKKKQQINHRNNRDKQKIILKCPLKFRVMKFPNSNFLLFCSMEKAKQKNEDKMNSSFEDSDEKGQVSDCPVNDPLNRALCCIPKSLKNNNNEINTNESNSIEKKISKSQKKIKKKKIILPTRVHNKHQRKIVESKESYLYNSNELVSMEERTLSIIPSTDSTCPTVMTDRTCIPRLMDTCVEEGFFCHFNRELKNFMCCSLREIKNKIL